MRPAGPGGTGASSRVTQGATQGRVSTHGDVAMLLLLMMLLSDPSVPPAPPVPVAEPFPEIRLQVLDGRLEAGCSAGGLQRIERPTARTGGLENNLLYTSQDEVRRYLLLDRTIRGCPAPISYAVPFRSGGASQDPPPMGSLSR